MNYKIIKLIAFGLSKDKKYLVKLNEMKSKLLLYKNQKYLNNSEQILLLKSKHIYTDKDTKKILSIINYYNLMNFKNVFYKNGELHNYKKNIKFNDFYELYQIDNTLKQVFLVKLQYLKSILINNIVNYLNINFKENKYLNNNLYKNNYIYIKYNYMIKKNDICKKYYDEHNFLPIWIILNVLNYVQFIEYIQSFNNNIYYKIFKKISLQNLIFSKLYFERITTGEKIYDFSNNDMNINNILDLFMYFKLETTDIIKLYNNIYNNISSISKLDVIRVTGIKEGYLK